MRKAEYEISRRQQLREHALEKRQNKESCTEHTTPSNQESLSHLDVSVKWKAALEVSSLFAGVMKLASPMEIHIAEYLAVSPYSRYWVESPFDEYLIHKQSRQVKFHVATGFFDGEQFFDDTSWADLSKENIIQQNVHLPCTVQQNGNKRLAWRNSIACPTVPQNACVQLQFGCFCMDEISGNSEHDGESVVHYKLNPCGKVVGGRILRWGNWAVESAWWVEQLGGGDYQDTLLMERIWGVV
eukprot:Lankesteria_metandrocarpae@DN1336_c0_g1_i2.p1